MPTHENEKVLRSTLINYFYRDHNGALCGRFDSTVEASEMRKCLKLNIEYGDDVTMSFPKAECEVYGGESESYDRGETIKVRLEFMSMQWFGKISEIVPSRPF